MTQKDKVKELVGRGLHSYHTKSLQQMDRIEKKNKEQNHKISILSNELDNDYLTKTEEGSVVSLEHSKEGMVYLDELQGNTLVNYCTDGSKEMTLNGDIDVEGVSVTTTEGVDNGLVDIMCEGNTLVNLKYGKSGNNCTVSCNNNTNNQYFILEENSRLHCKGEVVETARNLGLSWVYYPMGNIRTSLLKPNTTYTVILDNKVDSITGIYLQHGNSTNVVHKTAKKITKDIFTITTKDSFEGITINDNSTILYGSMSWDYKGKVDYRIIAFLEGDWSEKEIPNSFFEGMQSVGQDDANGHKIEILSQNKNLFNGEYELGYINTSIGYIADPNANGLTTGWIKCKPNTKYIASGGDRNRWLLRNKDGKETIIGGTIGNETPTVTTLSDTAELRCYFRWSSSDEEVESVLNSFQIEEGATRTTYTKGLLNKKEISLNAPLRSLPNGVKDELVKIGGKWYIERNCGEFTVTEDVLTTNTWGDDGNKRYIYVYILPNMKNDSYIYTDKIPTANNFYDSNYFGVSSTSVLIFCFPTEIQTIEEKKELVKPYLQNGGLKVTYQLNTPTYEPLEIEPVLNTYNDITHISNNSIIPCNMKIKNSGYNAIIKPSTQYTVALDTNKSGTVGINLGGAKVTTTNNVATITTPATLADDSLRIYGKDIKGSKVRLLEGDKTNWIPSHFEGMKSSFEDKLQEDGSYKMEILSNNKNLFDINTYYSGSAIIEFKNHGFRLHTTKPITYADAVFKAKVKPFTNYKVYADKKVTSGSYLMDVYDKSDKWLANTDTTFNSKNNTELSFRFYCSSSNAVIGDVEYSNVRLIEVGNNTDFVEHKHNKIQFSSIEPLRSVDNTKDKFVFKDNKLMIERNCGAFKINSSQGFIRVSRYDNGYLYGFEKDFDEIKRAFPSNKIIKCDKLPYYPYSGGDITMKNINGEWIGTWSNETNRSVIMLRLKTKDNTLNSLNEYLKENPIEIVYIKTEPTYEEIPFELQKIILEGYENGTLFFDTNIPPTSTVTYAGETPIVKATKLNKTEVLNNTEDINDNIIPYLMDMDYRVVMLQLATEELEGGVSMARLFGGTYEMIKRDILSKRLTREEYGYRLADYYNAGKLTEEQVRELEDLR